jgi:lysozyme
MSTKQLLKDLVKVKLNQYQIQALTSFIEDRGISAFKNSTLLKFINKNELDMVPAELLRWTVENGRTNTSLVQLRSKEIELFTKQT